MYKLEKTFTKQDRFLNPSFSSTLLDQIYRSIDDGETTPTSTATTTFYTQQKPTAININKQITDRKHINNKPKTEKAVPVVKKTDSRKFHHRDHEQDALFFSSTSISSDSSSAGFSSDTDSLSRSFIPPRPKPVRTSASFRFEGEKQRNHVIDCFHRSSETKQRTETRGEEAILIKSKSRAVKIYNNLKKVKQPISPGGRLTSFLNSLFHNNNNNNEKKTNGSSCCKDERKKVASTTCSSASSFSRSCLSKTASFCHRDNYKTVRFCGVEEGRVKVEEATRKFLNEYRCNSYKKNDLVLLKDLRVNQNDDEDDDDVASCASSDLFELDHLGVLGDGRYCEELPVYGTTRVKC